MPAPAVDAAFKARIAANFTTIPTVGVTVSEPPSNGSSFIVLQYPVVNGEKPVLGRTFFEEGALRIVINVVRAYAETDGASWAATLASLFRDRNLGNGLETFTPNGPITNDAIDDGDFVELAVIVPYRYQYNDA